MTPNELLKNWLGDTEVAPEKILKAAGLQIPVNWGRQQAFINFAQPASGIVFAVQLDFAGETAYIGLSKSAECNDLTLLSSNLHTSAKELLLAVFEAQTQYTLNALSQPLGILPKIIDIVPIDNEIWNSALPFTLATVEKQALIANGLLVMPPSLVEKYAKMDYVSPLDTSILPQAEENAMVIVAHFLLDEQDATLEAGDYLMLPEIKMDQYPWPVTMLLANGIALTAELTDGQTLRLTGILDASPIQPDELSISLGTASIRYADLLTLQQGEAAIVPLGSAQQVLKSGQMVARGHITSFYDSTAFEIEV